MGERARGAHAGADGPAPRSKQPEILKCVLQHLPAEAAPPPAGKHAVRVQQHVPATAVQRCRRQLGLVRRGHRHAAVLPDQRGTAHPSGGRR